MTAASRLRLFCHDLTSSARAPHGGRLDLARRSFPDAPQPWIDLSTGVNPHPYPLPHIAPEAWTRLPDADALAELEGVAACAYHAPSSAHVVAGAGTQAFIQWLPRLIPARRVAVLGLTYEEHALAWRLSGASVERVATVEELARADAAVVVNPNNPDGRLEQAERLAEVGRRMARNGRLLVVDEAFMDMLPPSSSLVPNLPNGGVVVLRSFGKAYGLPGLRLGFAVCDAQLAARLRTAMGPWSVSGPALTIGTAALADASWLGARSAELEQAALRLDALLAAAGFAIIGGLQLFRLVSHQRAAFWFEHLASCGILTRAFAERPSWLRFGVPGSPQAWERLEGALRVGHGA
ncbi:MAG: threonine-phosphate decarboxylase [Methylocystis sp.]|nr:threonine-phosphate decarboxylase [Methylocystis sp.]MBI3274561.1 threonine-phosphate decarboxylase [Methylocystis sp.]